VDAISHLQAFKWIVVTASSLITGDKYVSINLNDEYILYVEISVDKLPRSITREELKD